MPATSPALTRICARSHREDRGYLTPCRIWTGAKVKGYGCLNVLARRTLVHRFIYEHVYGEIPKGLVLDHLCQQKDCWEPLHLEAVTHAENCRRGPAAEINSARLSSQTHCLNGHEFTPENTYYRPDTGARRCNECRRIRDRKRDRSRPAPRGDAE